MRIMAVDPGEKRIGIAITDPTGVFAHPLTVINHVERKVDAGMIVDLAEKNSVELIVIGQPLSEDGLPGFQARKSERLADAIKSQSLVQVDLWDESGSTQEARETRSEMQTNRRNRKGHLDELAATIILQSYLEAHHK